MECAAVDTLTLHDTRQSPVVLELVEGLFQHVLGVDLLHTQQVEHHVVGQVEGAVQRVRRALKHTIKTLNQKCFHFDHTQSHVFIMSLEL